MKYTIKRMSFEEEYYIENEKGNLMLGNLTYEEAKFYVDNPEFLESTVKRYKFGMLLILAVVALFLIFSGALN